MCNKVHKNPENKFEEIPFSGTGWKIVSRFDTVMKALNELRDFWLIPITPNEDVEKYRPCVGVEEDYTNEEEGYFTWDDSIGDYLEDQDGFCFFQEKEIAERAMRLMIWLQFEKYLVQIRYTEGLGSFLELEDEGSWPEGTRFSICKKFKFME